ncbi:MAG: carbohydrate ABC transporter substrate-binding protein [Chloroflexi bacterium]|nr:carbohydrate ABC transporter substrate-binding protein [Chloroflexota bacterium]
MSKRMSLLLVIAILVGTFGIGVTQAQDATELSLWVFVERHGTFMQNQAARWNEVNPDRPINLTFETIEYTQMHDNLLASLLVGMGAPDLADVEIKKFATFTKGDIQFVPLNDAIDPYRADIIESRLAPYTAGGNNYGIDYHLGSFVMYYNTAILEAAGVDVNSIVTWDDYIEAGKKVTQDTDGDGTPDVYMTTIETTDIFSTYPIMLMMGGGTYNAEGDIILDSPENVAALQFVQDLVHVHGIARPVSGGNHHSADNYLDLTEGRVASLWMPQWYMTRFPDNMSSALAAVEVVRPMPIFEEGGYTTTMGGGTGTVITNQIDPSKVELAKEFLAFAKLTYDANVALWTDLGFDPMRVDVYEDPALLITMDDFMGEVPFTYIKAGLGNVAPEYTGPFYPEIATIFQTTVLYDLLENQMAPDEVIAAALSELQAMGAPVGG